MNAVFRGSALWARDWRMGVAGSANSTVVQDHLGIITMVIRILTRPPGANEFNPIPSGQLDSIGPGDLA
ncbi:MAG: hypothetical protein DWQ40_05020, partial [Actinobacteria bacterium]